MTALFLDLDGTLVKHHTNEWLPDALEMLNDLHKKGHQIIFTTQRDDIRDKGTEWSKEKTEALLSTLTFPYQILYDIQSPRILVNDRGASAVNHPTNESWKGKYLIK